MKYQPIITVGRQYGSGGRYVAKLLAEKLDIPFYDKELLAEASRDSGICQELLESYDEKQGKNLLFSLISGAQTRGEPGTMYMDMPLNHRIFLAQFDTIRRLVQEQGVDLGTAVSIITKNVADALQLYPDKGCIARDADADMVLLDRDLRITDVLAMGRIVVRDGELIAKNYYDYD